MATIFHQTPLEVAQGDTCKAPNLAYPNAITRYTSGIYLRRMLTHLVWPSDACQRVFRQQRFVVPDAAFLTAIMARWRGRRAPYRAQMGELTVILSMTSSYMLLSMEYPILLNILCLVKKLSLDSKVCCLCFPNDYVVMFDVMFDVMCLLMFDVLLYSTSSIFSISGWDSLHPLYLSFSSSMCH